MKKIFISVGMNGRTDDEVLWDIARAEKWIYENLCERRFEFEGVRVIDNFDCQAPEDAGCLWYLGEAIKKLDGCDICYFVKGWEKYRGCQAEMEICKLYGIEIIKEDEQRPGRYLGKIYREGSWVVPLR